MNVSRSVLIFSASVVLIFLGVIVAAGVKQGWFESSVSYQARYDNASGIYVGTPVTVSGLKAGKVTRVSLDESNRIVVELSIRKTFAERVRKDSVAFVGRPFVIGEKEVAVVPGSPSEPALKPKEFIKGEVRFEITDLLSGGKMSQYMGLLDKIIEQLSLVVEGDGSPDAVKLVDVYKKAYRALSAVEGLGSDVHSLRKGFFEGQDVRTLVGNLAKMSNELDSLVTQLDKAMPTLAKAGGDAAAMLPQLNSTLKDTSFTLKAAQKSFLLKGGVQDLMEEEEERRKPADER